MECEAFLPHLYDPFICTICLDTLTEPVTIPCGHSFCMGCIGTHWDDPDRGKNSVSCPLCLEKFSIRPQLRKSHLLSELLERSQTGGQQAAAPKPSSSPEDILCDFCTEEQTEAAKSCLVCMASYCEPHLKPHLKNPVFQSHRLVPPVRHMEEKLCKVHLKLLEGFCRTDQLCVCYLCSAQDHSEHEVVTLEQERKQQEAQRLPVLRRAEIQMQEIEANLIKLSKTVEFIKSTAVTEKADVKSLIAEASSALGKLQEEVTEFIESEEMSSLSLAEKSQKQLQERFQKLSQQRERLDDDVLSMDTISFIQELQALKKLSADMSFRSLNFEKELNFTKSSQTVRAVKDVLEDMCRNQWDTLSGKDIFQPPLLEELLTPVFNRKAQPSKYVTQKKHFSCKEDVLD